MKIHAPIESPDCVDRNMLFSKMPSVITGPKKPKIRVKIQLFIRMSEN
jgi:hypothetical protein